MSRGIFGLLVGLSYWLLLGLLQGVTGETIRDQQRMVPNQGIRRSALNGFVFGLISIMIGGLSTGLMAGLLKGGLACERHYALRVLLWRSGTIPWNYPQFLDFAAESILLRKVGGGYIFLHRLLLDYFADLETKPGSDEKAKSRQERLQPETVPSAPTKLTRVDAFSEVPPAPLAPTPVLSEVPRLLPCGHAWRPNARFCGVCGTPVPS